MKKTELLLPAGTMEALKAAVGVGADAVYLAGNKYGARANAANFNNEEMAIAVELCHRHDVKVYVAVNTLIGDDELSAALDYSKFLYDLGIDGLIVQDWGFFAAVKKCLPNLPLHGSTQMTVHNLETARFCVEMGMKRIILAREMTLDEIRIIRENLPGLEVEVFCHGALCISYSGQCLMSSMIGGRSGNRGSCAQPCRLAYDVVDAFGNYGTEKPTHLLSPKDLNTLDILPDLLELGVHSLKIEGRMRRAEYVATVGRVYRKAIDSWYQGKYQVSAEDKQDVAQVFNREFTDGYFNGNQGADMMSHDRPNNRGVAIGRVKAVHGKEAAIELTGDLVVGDGIEVWVKVGGRVGATVNKMWQSGKNITEAVKGDIVEVDLSGNIKAGDRVFKTYDSKMMKKALAGAKIVENKATVDFEVFAATCTPLKITAFCDDGRKTTAVSDYIVEAATKTPTSVEAVEKQLSRLGGTDFTCGNVTLYGDEGVLLPASILNGLRRDLVKQLDALVMKGQEKRYPHVSVSAFEERKEAALGIIREKKKKPLPVISVKVADVYQADAAFDGGAEFVYIAPHLARMPFKQDDWVRLSAMAECHGNALGLSLPSVCPDSFVKLKENIIEQTIDCGIKHLLAGSVGDIHYKDKYNFETVWGDYSLNVFNVATANTMYDRGFDGVNVGYELTKGDLAYISKTAGQKEVIVHGAVPMMISRHCVVGATFGKNPRKVPCGINCHANRYVLIDRMEKQFPLILDSFHQMNIYNPCDLALIDELRAVFRFDRLRIEGQLLDMGSLKEIIGLYRRTRDYIYNGEEFNGKELFDELKPYHSQGYTKGHFKRGVKEVIK